MGSDKQYDIHDEQEYEQALSTLSRSSQPPAILRLLMRAFEGYRAARKMGWSRPWNKYDLINFQSFRLRPQQDQALIELGHRVLSETCPELPTDAQNFVDELLQDAGLMGFVFCHEYHQQGRLWEGATLSLGRKVQKRFRDRVDIILESELVDGKSMGLTRVRIYIDPYIGKPSPPQWEFCKEEGLGEASRELFARLSDISWTWFADPERRWDHWTSRYIDYFGERQQELKQSYFLLKDHTDGRLPSGGESERLP